MARAMRAILLAALAGSFGSALAGPSAAAIPPAPSSQFYGVTTATPLSDRELDLMATGELKTLRIPVYWPHLSPDPPPSSGTPSLPEESPVPDDDDARWRSLDDLVERAARRGIRLQPFIYGTPDWVAADPTHPPLASRDARRAWRGFLGDLVARYGPGGEIWRQGTPLDPGPPELPITAWQIWNEPNSPVFWRSKAPPRNYARLVRISSAAIRDVDPAATVVLGGMFGTPTQGIRAWRFLDRFHAASDNGSFDAYALHPYAPNLSGIRLQIRRSRAAMRRDGTLGTPLWITEIGWPTRGPKRFRMVKSERGQKRLLARSFRLFVKRRPWAVERVVWYTWRDNDVQSDCTVCKYSGLFDKRLRAKPAWGKLTQFSGGNP